MRALSFGNFRFLALVVAAVTLAVVGWALFAGGPAEPAVSSQPDGIQVISPAGVATFEGELRPP